MILALQVYISTKLSFFVFYNYVLKKIPSCYVLLALLEGTQYITSQNLFLVVS